MLSTAINPGATEVGCVRTDRIGPLVWEHINAGEESILLCAVQVGLDRPG